MVDKVHSKFISVIEGKLTIRGRTIPYIVKRSTRAMRVLLEIRRDAGLTVVIPKLYSIERLHSLLREKEQWILDNVVACDKVASPSARKEIRVGDIVPYLGKEFKILTKQNNGKTNWVTLGRNSLIISLTCANTKLNVLLEQWYRTQAAKLIKEKVEKWNAKLDVSHNRITIRGQKTRWGSCSHKGNISFNWKLIMTPESVIDYVVIHELTHLRVMNHSKWFWQLVAQRCPGWKERRKWLKKHGAELLAGLVAR